MDKKFQKLLKKHEDNLSARETESQALGEQHSVKNEERLNLKGDRDQFFRRGKIDNARGVESSIKKVEEDLAFIEQQQHVIQDDLSDGCPGTAGPAIEAGIAFIEEMQSVIDKKEVEIIKLFQPAIEKSWELYELLRKIPAARLKIQKLMVSVGRTKDIKDVPKSRSVDFGKLVPRLPGTVDVNIDLPEAALNRPKPSLRVIYGSSFVEGQENLEQTTVEHASGEISIGGQMMRIAKSEEPAAGYDPLT